MSNLTRSIQNHMIKNIKKKINDMAHKQTKPCEGQAQPQKQNKRKNT